MSRTGLFEWARSLKAKASASSRRRKARPAARRLRLEALEDRLALTTYFVTTTDDGDLIAPAVGTLRAAILQANANPGPDTIQSSLGFGSQKISLLAALPPLTDQVTINGLSTVTGQKMEINGAAVPTFANGLQIETDFCEVRNLVIEHSPATAIFIADGSWNVVEHNELRFQQSAQSRIDPGVVGVAINASSAGGASHNIVRYNNIHHNSYGIGMGYGAQDNTIENNTISDNLFDGVFLFADGDGIQFAPTSGNVFSGNLIERNANGIVINGSVEFPVNSGVNLGATGNTIHLNNVITANRENGILIDGFNATGNIVQGNSISDNGGHGVRISGAADGNTIGAPGMGNIIHDNDGDGVMVQELGYDFFPGYPAYQANGQALNNSIQGNDIFGNWGLPIDLNNDGLTFNDPNDSDSGPNNLQNWPVITVARSGASTFVVGNLHSLPGTFFTLDFYASSAAGQRWLDSLVRATDGSGNVSFNGLLDGATVAGEVVGATATDSSGNTSEFSLGVTVTDLMITGTAADDTYVLSAHSPTGAVEVLLNGVSQGIAAQIFLSDPNGSDTYTVNFGGWTGNVILNDIGGAGTDTLNLNGTVAADQFNKQFTLVDWNLDATPSITSRVNYAGIETFNVFGDDGNDTILDPADNTNLFGGAGDDTIIIDATFGNGVVVDGGDGSDNYVVMFGNLAGPVTVADSGTIGVDSLEVQGTAGDDDLSLAGNEVQNGAERIIIVAPVESLNVDAGEGADLITVGDFTAPIASLGLDGGAGTNQVSIEGSLPPGVEVDIVGATQSVQIDVLRDTLNLASNGVIAVAVFTTANFDAALVDAGSVVFAGAHVVHSALADVDFDGDLDMVLHFRMQDTNLRTLYAQLLADDLNGDGVLDSTHQELDVSLTGQTVDDVFFEGFDSLDVFLSGKSLRELLLDLAAAGSI